MSRVPSAFLPALLLAVICIAAKLVVAWPVITAERDVRKLFAVTATDVLFAGAYGIVAWGLLYVSRGKKRLGRICWVGVTSFGAVAGVYAVASVGVMTTLGFPLNARMFGLVSRFTDLRSSIWAHCHWSLLLGMVGAVLAYVALGRWGRRHHLGRTSRLVVILLGTAWVVFGSTLRAQSESGSWERRTGRNPHWEMLGSLVWAASNRLDVVGEFPAEYASDFAMAADFERPALPQYSPPPKNVIFVVLESVSAQYMSLYGSQFDTTPRLIAESKHALVVDRFYANAGYTNRSVVPIMYGVHPGLPWGWLPDGVVNMPVGMSGVLKQRGYRTALFAAGNPEWGGMGWIAQAAGMEQAVGPAELGGAKASSWGTEDGVMIDGLLRWIDEKPGQPFFVMAWTDQTHDPYTLEKGTRATQFVDPKIVRHGGWINDYLSALRQVDRHLGRLFDELRRRGLADDTLVVITGDHGEAFGWAHEAYSHGGDLYDECMRVPLMLWNPRLFAGGKRWEKTGGHVDINPTIAHLMNVDPHPRWQGASLFSPQHPGRAYMSVDLSGFVFGVSDGRWKYILHATDGFDRLFDLKNDPAELRDVSRQNPAQVREFRCRISAFVKEEEGYLQRNGGRP